MPLKTTCVELSHNAADVGVVEGCVWYNATDKKVRYLDDVGNKTLVEDSDSRLTDARTPTAHNIDSHSDVDTTTAAPNVGDHLEWNGTNWVPATPGGGGDPTSSGVSVSTTATRTLSSYALLPSMTLTPGAGNYLVLFSGTGTNDSNSALVSYQIFVNGVATGPEISHEGRFQTAVAISHRITGVGAGQAVEIRWKTTAGTASHFGRSLNLLKVA